MSQQSSWREVVDPETRKTLFVNTDTGDCAWKAPPDELPIKSSPSEWWEFIDQKANRHYYYQLQTGKSRWRRPRKGVVVFMAKLQAEKHETLGDARPRPVVPPKPTPYTKSQAEKKAAGSPGTRPDVHIQSMGSQQSQTGERDPDAPVWLSDASYDLCLIHSDQNSFADELTGYFNDLAVRCYRHYPSSLIQHRRECEDINDEENPDPAHSSTADALKSSKFFMFIFSRAFLDTDSQFDHGDVEDIVLSHFAPDDPVHANIELPNLLPILDGTTQEELKKYSKSMGSKIPISTSIGAKRLSEMFFKKLTGQMPSANFRLQDYLKKKMRSS